MEEGTILLSPESLPYFLLISKKFNPDFKPFKAKFKGKLPSLEFEEGLKLCQTFIEVSFEEGVSFRHDILKIHDLDLKNINVKTSTLQNILDLLSAS